MLYLWYTINYAAMSIQFAVEYTERPILVKRPMSDVPIFRRKNSDVRFRCLVVYHLMLSKHQSYHVTDDSGHQQTRSVN